MFFVLKLTCCVFTLGNNSGEGERGEVMTSALLFLTLKASDGGSLAIPSRSLRNLNMVSVYQSQFPPNLNLKISSVFFHV